MAEHLADTPRSRGKTVLVLILTFAAGILFSVLFHVGLSSTNEMAFCTSVRDLDKEGRTALMEAVSVGALPLVQLLLAHGADPTHQDKNGSTAVDMAWEARNRAIYDALKGTY